MIQRMRLQPEAIGSGLTSQRVRDRLVERLREAGIRDERVLNAIRTVPRHLFVDEALAMRAYEDTALPIGHNQTISQPWVVARMTEALFEDGPPAKVLEIGTGSGYQAALLAYLAQQVTTVEIDSRLATFAQQNLQVNNVTDVKVETGDGRNGWGSTEYDAILVTGSVPVVPDALKYQLRVGGRLVVIVGQAPIMTAYRITRTTAASFETVSLFETVIKPLRGTTVSQFKF